MDATTLAAIRGLLDTERVLTTAVMVDGEPVAALLPYAIGSTHGSLLVQASGLARHTRGLIHGATIGIVVHRAVTPDLDAMQIPRLTVQATVHVLDRDDRAFDEAAARFIQRFAHASTTLALGDFRLFELILGRGRYVEGFARAFNVSVETFRSIAH